MSIQTGLLFLFMFVFGIVSGLSMGLLLASEPMVEIEVPVITEKIIEVEKPIITEKVVTVEIEKPIVTQQIVETVREVEVYRFIDEDQRVHKWIDPDNHAVVYIYPEGYTGHIMPLYTLVPPVWFEQMLRIVLENNNGTMPLAIIRSIPPEWLDAVAPGANPINQGFD